MKRVFAVLLLPVGLMFASCEGNTDYETVVKNNSNKSITIKFHGGNGHILPQDTIMINAGSTEVVNISNQMGGQKDALDPTAFTDSVYTKLEGATLKKDILNAANWQSDIDRRKRVPADNKHTYTFTINQADIQ